jgi:polysaccharide pyruvyl transferase WcaK-like protein
LLRKKFGFLGIGLEGAKVESSRAIAQIFREADFLYLRDIESYEVAKQSHKPHKLCILGGDLAFLDLDIYQSRIKKEKTSEIRNLSFSGKYWWGEGRAEFYAKPLLALIERYGTKIHFLPG